MLTKQQLQCMKENELMDEVLIGLLTAIGYRDVTKYHGGSAEQGKDIVCWKNNELGSRINLALVIKAVPVTGKASISRGTAGEVCMQIQQCFGKPFTDPVTGEERSVHICWVVTNQTISKEAEDAIMAGLRPETLNRNVSFVNGDRLWELIERYMPVQAVWQKLEDAKALFDSLDSHYVPRVDISKEGIHVSLEEKYPGAAQERPITVKPIFTFPETAEGQMAKESLLRSFATGDPVDIPGKFIDRIELPNFLKGIYDEKVSSLHVESVPQPGQFVGTVELQCNDGDTLRFDRVHFNKVQEGADETTLINDSPSDPIIAKLVLKLNVRTASVSFSFRPGPWNAFQTFQILRFRECASKPFLFRLTHAETDILVLEIQQEKGFATSPDHRFVEMVKDLAAIQKRTKRLIFVPTRMLTDDEIRMIQRLREVLHKRKNQLTSLSLSLARRGVDIALETFKGESPGALLLEAERSESLFDTELPLGRIRIYSPKVLLSNEMEVRKQLSAVVEDEDSVECIFSPASDAELNVEYLDW